MSLLSRATFTTTWAGVAGNFLTNGIRAITALIMRGFSTDVKDSVLFFNDDYDYFIQNATASGTDTYTITPTIPTSYTTGERFLITFTNANTGASTLNRNSLGAKDLKTISGAALTAGQIVAGGRYIVVYNGTYYQVLGVASGGGPIGGSTGAVDNAILRSDGTGGATLQTSEVYIDDFGNVDIHGTGQSPSSLAQIRLETGLANSNNTIDSPLRVYHRGGDAAGVGVGMEFGVRTAVTPNDEIGGIAGVECVDVTGAAEDFNYVLSVMSNGAAAVRRMVVMGKRTTLTETTATAFARIALSSSQYVGGEVVVSVQANDATDFQVRTLRFLFSAVNKAGTITVAIETPVEVVAVSAGTLTVTITAVDSGSGNLDFKADATSSLTQTSLKAQAYVIKNWFGTISSQ